MLNSFNYNRAVAAFPVATVSATGRSLVIDTAKSNGILLALLVGAVTGSPDGSNKFALAIEHSDSLAAASFEAVPDAYFLTRPDGALAKLPAALDSAGAFAKNYLAGLRKTNKRYLSITWTKTGTVSAPFALTALLDSVGDLPPTYATAGQMTLGATAT